MAGYSDTRQLIIDTLMGRPAGTEIQPEDHQAFALALNDYIRNVELNSGNAFIGFAQADTVPIQSDNGQCFYISTVPQGTNIVYANFIDYEGNPISVTTPPNKMAFVTLIWNTRNWDSQITIIETNWSQVLEDNIASGAVTGSKIAPNSIDSSKIIDGTIQSTDLNSNAFDNTLTTPGKIAPADVVGSKLTELESIVSYKKLTISVTWIDGKYLNLSDGTDNDFAGWSITDYIEISQFSNMSFSDFVEGGGTAALCYYDEGKNYLGGVGIGNYVSEQMLAPSGAKYVRFCTNTGNKSIFSYSFTRQSAGLSAIEGEKKIGIYLANGNGLDNLPYSVAGLVLNHGKQFKSLRVGCIASGTEKFHIVNEDNYSIIETITKEMVQGENIILPSDFEFDFKNDKRNICIYCQNASDQSSDRIVAFTTGSGATVPCKYLITFDSEVGYSIKEDADITISMEVTYYEKVISSNEERINHIEKNIGISPIFNLQEYINNHSGQVIQLGAEIYYISTHLYIPNGTRICGIRGKTIFKLTGSATECVYFDGNSKDITIENITFEGGAPITPSATTMDTVRSRVGEGTKCGIYSLGYAKDIQICHCEFRNFNLAGIRILNSFTGTFYETYKITDCNFAHNFYGLLSDKRSEYHTVMGCSMCYNVFSSEIEKVLKNKSTEHIGKIPKKSKTEIIQKRKLKNLKDNLQQLILNEQYEDSFLLLTLQCLYFHPNQIFL